MSGSSAANINLLLSTEHQAQCPWRYEAASLESGFSAYTRERRTKVPAAQRRPQPATAMPRVQSCTTAPDPRATLTEVSSRPGIAEKQVASVDHFLTNARADRQQNPEHFVAGAAGEEQQEAPDVFGARTQNLNFRKQAANNRPNEGGNYGSENESQPPSPAYRVRVNKAANVGPASTPKADQNSTQQQPF